METLSYGGKSHLHVAAWLISAPLNALWSCLHEIWIYIRSILLTYAQVGPRGFPLAGIVFNFERNSVGLHKYVAAVMHNYPFFASFFVGPKLMSYIGNPRDLEMVLSSNKYLTKGFTYRFLEAWLGTGLLTSTGEKWRARRKILTPAFHFKILEQFLPVMLSNSDIFVQQLRKRAGAASFDVFPLCSLLTLDVICETAMGVKVSAQLESESVYVNAVKDMANTTMLRGYRPWLYPDLFFRLSSIGRMQAKALKVLHDTTYKVINERREELQKLRADGVAMNTDDLGRRRRVAFLDLLLLAATEEGGALSDTDICEEVDTFMFEGHDTTASAVAFTLYLLAEHQDVQKKVIAELESIFDASKQLNPTYQDLSEMKYLEMVIKESMRLFPPVPVIFRKVVEDTPLLSREDTVPRSSVFLLSMYALHRNRDLYQNADDFDPERFAPDNSTNRHPFSYLPFSAGPRNCIGQRFAMMELKTAVAKAVWNFRLLPEPGFEPFPVWELILKTENGIRMKLEERRERS